MHNHKLTNRSYVFLKKNHGNKITNISLGHGRFNINLWRIMKINRVFRWKRSIHLIAHTSASWSCFSRLFTLYTWLLAKYWYFKSLTSRVSSILPSLYVWFNSSLQVSKMDGRQHKRMLLRIVHQLKLHQECYCRKYREDLGSGFFEDGTAASIPTQRKCLARPSICSNLLKIKSSSFQTKNITDIYGRNLRSSYLLY
jgi:hypothetical protein